MPQRQPEVHEQATDAQALLFLRIAVVMRLTGLGRSTIYRLMAEDKFPSPVWLAKRGTSASKPRPPAAMPPQGAPNAKL